MWGSHMSMYQNASGKAMVSQWDQKAIARMQLCSSNMLSSFNTAASACAPLVVIDATTCTPI